MKNLAGILLGSACFIMLWGVVILANVESIGEDWKWKWIAWWIILIALLLTIGVGLMIFGC